MLLRNELEYHSILGFHFTLPNFKAPENKELRLKTQMPVNREKDALPGPR